MLKYIYMLQNISHATGEDMDSQIKNPSPMY